MGYTVEPVLVLEEDRATHLHAPSIPQAHQDAAERGQGWKVKGRGGIY